MAAITSTKTDFIFISDIRLVSPNGVPSEERVRTAFRDVKNNSYEAFFNSTKNGRGVGILVANSLNYSYQEQINDNEQNFIAIKGTLSEKLCILVSVYGPNTTDRKFFGDLERAINQLRGNSLCPVIMGGDWNTTWDNRNVQVNIDTFHMAGPPNPQNSEHLKTLCTNLDLTDPYRLLYPNKRDFTYQPFGTVRLNRSRIDFFCVSNSIAGHIEDCSIGSSVLCSLFDHKNIKLTFGTMDRSEKSKNLSNRFLDEKILKSVVICSAHRCEIFSIDRLDEEINNLYRDEKNKNDNVWQCIKNYFELEFRDSRGEDPLAANLAAAELTNIDMLIEDLCPSGILKGFGKVCTKVEFFTALVSEVKKSSIWAQKKLFQIAKAKVGAYENRINLLKSNFDANFNAIFALEKKVAKIKDDELRLKLRDLKIFECLNAEKASPHFLNIANKSKKESSLCNILKTDGEAFPDQESREKHIVDFYSDLYKQDLTVNGNIDDFLGPDIVNRPQIQASKLTLEEKTSLDSPLSIDELDKSLKQVNIKSAPGIDGYSYRFI